MSSHNGNGRADPGRGLSSFAEKVGRSISREVRDASSASTVNESESLPALNRKRNSCMLSPSWERVDCTSGIGVFTTEIMCQLL